MIPLLHLLYIQMINLQQLQHLGDVGLVHIVVAVEVVYFIRINRFQVLILRLLVDNQALLDTVVDGELVLLELKHKLNNQQQQQHCYPFQLLHLVLVMIVQVSKLVQVKKKIISILRHIYVQK